MRKIKIFTDSAADLPAEVVARYEVGVVPLLVTFGDRVFADGRDLSSAEFYKLLAQAPTLPTTSQPSPQDFIDAFQPYLDTGHTIISINLSSSLSGTVASATLAQESLDQAGQQQIHIVDSKAASIGQGLLVCLASHLAQQGRGVEEILTAVSAARQRLMHLFTLETMDNLVKGGRISRAKAIIGGMLDIKPILWLDDDGKIDTLEKVRGRKKSLKYLTDKCLAELDVSVYPYVGICHANCPEEAAALAKVIEQAVPAATVVVGDIGATIGTHTGVGCMAVFYFH